MISEMFTKIDQSTAQKKSRITVSNFAMKKDENLAELIAIALDVSHQNHVKAFWSLELVCTKKLKLLLPYIDKFCAILSKLTDDSAVRPATKICMFLAKSNYRKNGIKLSKEQEHVIIENLIDRLIQDEKVGTKYYAIKALFVLGKKYDWIHPELKTILEQGYAHHSPAYKAVAREVLKKLNK